MRLRVVPCLRKAERQRTDAEDVRLRLTNQAAAFAVAQSTSEQTVAASAVSCVAFEETNSVAGAIASSPAASECPSSSATVDHGTNEFVLTPEQVPNWLPKVVGLAQAHNVLRTAQKGAESAARDIEFSLESQLVLLVSEPFNEQRVKCNIQIVWALLDSEKRGLISLFLLSLSKSIF